MKCFFLFFVLFSLSFAPVEGRTPKPALPEPKPLPQQIQLNMTADQVHKILGKPDLVVRQILFRKHLEQWIYNQPVVLHVEFRCRKGEEARVLSVQSRGDLPNP